MDIRQKKVLGRGNNKCKNSGENVQNISEE